MVISELHQGRSSKEGAEFTYNNQFGFNPVFAHLGGGWNLPRPTARKWNLLTRVTHPKTSTAAVFPEKSLQKPST